MIVATRPEPTVRPPSRGRAVVFLRFLCDFLYFLLLKTMFLHVVFHV